MTPYQQFIHTSRYARYRDDLGRRETWDETVDRVHEFWKARIPAKLHSQLFDAMEAVRRMEIMPSMRIMMTAGPALEQHHVAGYNCSYTPIDHPRKFSEVLYILMCGTGLGFSVEREYIKQLPEVPHEFKESDTVIKVRDSKLGWASGYRELIQLLYGGRIPQWDMSKVRLAGSRLKTFGGRASGPDPLDALFKFTVDTFRKAAGRRLNSLEVHGLICKIADIVVVGGVRRSALISLSNLSDDRMRTAKSGDWYRPVEEGGRPYLALANNSVAYTVKPDTDSFLREMFELYMSRAGERGIFSREACVNKYSNGHRRDEAFEFGTNPCSEIILRPDQFCNLSEVILRPDDTVDSALRKVRLATFLGTLQSTLTDFKFLGTNWKKNCEEERLLGVSLTGIMDHPFFGDPEKAEDTMLKEALEKLRDAAINENQVVADALGIERSTAVTCVKPSGTVSQLCDTASGLHPRYAPYYIRRVRVDDKDPVCQYLIDQGVPHEEDFTNKHCQVFSFPCAAPEGAIVQDNLSAIDHLKLWRLYNDYWCEHKPSVTISYTDEEFPGLLAYVWDNFDAISGVSFLPKADAIYKQAPYEAVGKDTYDALVAAMPTELRWEDLIEDENNTSVQPELACHGGACEL